MSSGSATPAGRTAKAGYRPVGVTRSIVGGLPADLAVEKIW